MENIGSAIVLSTIMILITIFHESIGLFSGIIIGFIFVISILTWMTVDSTKAKMKFELDIEKMRLENEKLKYEIGNLKRT